MFILSHFSSLCLMWSFRNWSRSLMCYVVMASMAFTFQSSPVFGRWVANLPCRGWSLTATCPVAHFTPAGSDLDAPFASRTGRHRSIVLFLLHDVLMGNYSDVSRCLPVLRPPKMKVCRSHWVCVNFLSKIILRFRQLHYDNMEETSVVSDFVQWVHLVKRKGWKKVK